MAKKDFSKAVSSAADKFFSVPPQVNETNSAGDDNTTKHTNTTQPDNNTIITEHDNNPYQANDTIRSNNTKVKNKSKHYDERGKREERYGLLLDKQLKEDLKNLANAYGSRSVNDFIVTILLDYVESVDNQKILEAYNQLQKMKNAINR